METRTIHIHLLITVLLLSSIGILPATAQQLPGVVRFKQGEFRMERNITNTSFRKDSLRPALYKKRYFVLLQFDRLPDSVHKRELADRGIHLYDYIPDRAFLAGIEDSISTDDLRSYGVSAVSPLPAAYKIASRLHEHPEDYLRDPGQLIAVSFFGGIDSLEVRQGLAAAGAMIVPSKMQAPHVLFIRVDNAAVLQKIIALPYISYIAPQSIQSHALNYNNRAAHGADALTSLKNLRGDGVVVGIGDDSDPYSHVDFTGRLIDRFSTFSGTHGVHTSGIVAGGGILDPKFQGMAPHSTIISQYFTDILNNTQTYINDYDMVVTSNSYTNAPAGCPYNGEYDFLAYFTDAQLYSYAGLNHVFASGNEGNFPCSPFPDQYFTVKSGFQSAKNSLVVGNLDNVDSSNYLINFTSSSGPTIDGRIKPEIVAGGTNITSTFPDNTYGTTGGTSMACPTVSGSLALLEQRFRQLYGSDSYGALLKALLCNSATDLGNPGPDYLYGFGMLNARAAVETMEKGQMWLNTVANGTSKSFNIPVPAAGAGQLKVMLYWTDYPAQPGAATALVNNLDLTVTAPGAILHHPLILHPDPAHVTDYAVEGVDNLNNIEQVVINNPAGGNYAVKVTGTSVPMTVTGSQLCFVVWQIIQPSVQLLYPVGGETWVPKDNHDPNEYNPVSDTTETFRWNANGGEPNTFTLEYSSDNGSTWSTIDNAIGPDIRLYHWARPQDPTNQGRIRVTRNNTPYYDSSSLPITILGQPQLVAGIPCQGYARLTWNTIPAATSYDIMQLKGDSMIKIASTTDTSYLVGGLNRDSSYWLTARAVNGSSPGRRAIAVFMKPSGGACTFNALDNDYTVDSLIDLHSGRQFTSSQLDNATPIRVEIKNLGTLPTGSSYTLNYRINGGAPVVENSPTPVPVSGGILNYTFAQTADFSAAGTYTLQVWVHYPGDPGPANDTITTVIRQLSNAPITLNPSYTEGFESAASATYTSPTRGFTGMDRCDFFATDPHGRVRTFVNTGFARTGSNCATLDRDHADTTAYTTSDSLVLTFNLSAYSASDQLWLDFYYKNYGIDSNFAGNQVWIRGDDQSSWLPVYTLDASAADFGVYRASSHINISQILQNAAPTQTVSSSFQIKFGEQGHTSANSLVTDGDLDDGYSFDDITLSRSTNDIGVTALLTPDASNVCALSNAETISVKVKNYSATAASNIPVTYSINGAQVTEMVPAVNATDSVNYTFSQKANLSAFQSYTISAWSSYPGDSYHFNDTMAPVHFETDTLISTFPYLEGFETSMGYWYTGGLNSSWQWGTPSKAVINRAANGAKCWVTNLTGSYNNNELSYLYSPCFDLSGLSWPVLSFSHIFQTEDNCDCDYHWVEYSVDGVTWIKLGATGSGTNWYDNATRQAWQVSNTLWHVSSYDIPVRPSKIKFRIVMISDEATVYDGVGIDDIHIFDKGSSSPAIYSGADITSGLTGVVSGNGWIDFSVSGQRVASINPNGQNLGNTNVKVYFNTGTIRNDGTQYYLDRNIVIQPSTPPSGSVSVRYYFLETEAMRLIKNASGCPVCTTLSDAYQAGVTQYSSPVLSEEDGSLGDNASGSTTFHRPHQDVSVLPYDNGYYAEYSVGGFSEFWINNGGPTQSIPLPLTLLSFTAVKTGGEALLQWTTTQEKNIGLFFIERSADGSNYTILDSLPPLANNSAVHSYGYTDTHLLPGTNYYRLRMVDPDGHFSYSPVRTVDGGAGGTMVTIYPNPVINGKITINSPSPLERLRLTDVTGKTLLEVDVTGSEYTLPLGSVAKGVYLLIIDTQAGRQVQKVFVK